MLNQVFPVYYKSQCFMVDPMHLQKSSRKFKELLKTYLDTGYDLKSLRLRIQYNEFSERGVCNFLLLCQNLPTDTEDSEVEEICNIAKMFQADEIYNKGINFIQSSIDPNFFIPYNQFIDEQYLFIDCDETVLIHHTNLNELEFDESSNCFKEKVNETKSTTNKNNSNQKKYQSICYQIQVENPFLKCKKFHLINQGRIIYTAKQKENEIFICSGNSAHVNDEKQRNDARITQSRNGFNIITTEDQTFKISYTPKDAERKRFDINLSFLYKQKNLSWSTKVPKFPSTINGELNHVPIPSKKNMVLQNPSGDITFIVRKMKKKEYEAECHPALSPIIAFSIALSQIIGPYNS